MKRVLLCMIALSVSAITYAESYKVVKVLGTIIVKKTGAALSQGDVIQSTDPIVFKTPDSKASVISSEKGRFVLAANSSNNNSASVKSNLIPPMSNISSRGLSMLNFSDIKNNFSGNYLLLDKVDVSIAKDIFPMNDSCFFFFTYKYKNEDINKRLKHNGDTLLIIEKELFKVDGLPISHAESTFVKVNYYSKKTPLTINEMNVITPNLDQVKKECEMILNESQKKSYKEKVNDVTSYLNEFYGKIDEDNVKQWLKDNLGLIK